MSERIPALLTILFTRLDKIIRHVLTFKPAIQSSLTDAGCGWLWSFFSRLTFSIITCGK